MKKFYILLISSLFLISVIYQSKAQTYVGSGECQECHSTKYNDWVKSGHPYKFTVTPGNVGPIYPAEAINFQSTWLEQLGDGTHTWGDIAGVIGGYGWKTRFVGTDGIIIGTASSKFNDAGQGHNQINFFGGENHGWVDYDKAVADKKYNYACFKCHTTGGTTTGTWLAGVEGLGNFSEGGVGCEACHGPGSAHVAKPTKTNIDRVYEQVHADNSLGGLSVNGVIQTPKASGNDVNFMCGTCHNRSYTDPINSKGGFIEHHEQWDEFVSNKHGENGLKCTSCHDPHKRTIWSGDGITKTCTTCHSDHAATLNHAAGITCIDCHMPFAVKSGTARGKSGYKADVRSHLFIINPSTESMFNADGSAVRDDAQRKAALSPHFACLGCHNDSPDDAIADKTIEQVSAAAKGMHIQATAADYRGSKGCLACHETKYNDWVKSGHPYKFTITPGNVGPVYPSEALNFQPTWLENLGNGSHTWDDIAGVIGGYGWKTRFVGTDGNLIGTASSKFADAGMGHNQINFFGGVDHGWVDYDKATVNKKYDYACFKCHVTGGTTEGTWLAGVEGLGNFTEGGVGCEACHGPGALHASAPTKSNIDLVYEQVHMDNSIGGLSVKGVVQKPNPNGNDVNFMCGTCHNRSYTSPINAKGGFVEHHEQWDELVSDKHGKNGLSCSTCHDPHKRIIWGGDGITKTCEECHPAQVSKMNHSAGVTCIDCHMAYTGKSGTARGKSGYKGDVRSHLFSINTSTESMFSADGSVVRDDETRSAALSPHFACLGCHNDDPNDNIPDKTIEAAAASAKGMHNATSAKMNPFDNTFKVFPNPSKGTFYINFKLDKPGKIDLKVYDISGKNVYSLIQENNQPGIIEIVWEANNNRGMIVEPGFYFIEVKTPDKSYSSKLIKQ